MGRSTTDSNGHSATAPANSSGVGRVQLSIRAREQTASRPILKGGDGTVESEAAPGLKRRRRMRDLGGTWAMIRKGDWANWVYFQDLSYADLRHTCEITRLDHQVLSTRLAGVMTATPRGGDGCTGRGGVT